MQHDSPHLAPGGSKLVLELLRLTGADMTDPQLKLLFAGAKNGENALAIAKKCQGSVEAIEEDSEAVLLAKMASVKLGYGSRLAFRYMAPVSLAFPDDTFDIVILEGIISSYPKHRVIAEARRVLKPAGILALSDSFWLKPEVPQFVRDVWESPEYQILDREQVHQFLDTAGFRVGTFHDKSRVLEPFYQQFTGDVKDIVRGGFQGMKHMKALVKHYKHEIDVYLKHGGRKWMGYMLVVAKKSEG